MYDLWHYLHLGCVALSGFGFALRGFWMIVDSPLRQAKPAKIVPHVVDTLLLASGIGLLVTLNFSILEQGWLLAKVIALVLYILLGLVAFRLGRTQGMRVMAFIAALATFAYLVAVGFSRDPLPFT